MPGTPWEESQNYLEELTTFTPLLHAARSAPSVSQPQLCRLPSGADITVNKKATVLGSKGGAEVGPSGRRSLRGCCKDKAGG
jgi:hypothetical protein